MQFSTVIGAIFARLDRQISAARGTLPASGVVAAVELILVVACAWQAAALIWQAAAPSTLGPVPAAGRSAAASGFAPRLPQAVTLSTVDLFHRSDAGLSLASAGSSAEPPATTLALQLMGVRANGDPSRSSAIIQRPDKSQDAFRVGQEIAEGAVLDAVYSDRVIIRRNGVRETLPIDKTRLLTAAPAEPAMTVDPARLFEAVQLNVGEDGRLVLMPGSDIALFAQSGLQAGDVLVSVNGRPVESAAALAEVVAGNAGRAVSIETDRNGLRRVMRLAADR